MICSTIFFHTDNVKTCKFNVNVAKYFDFKDTYMSLIYKNNNTAEIQKFCYSCASLKSVVLESIRFSVFCTLNVLIIKRF